MNKWNEVLDGGDRIRWDTPGMEITGTLISFEQVDTTYGKAREVTVQINDQMKKFYATSDLSHKLESVPVGSEIRITYTGDVKTRSGTMKKFNVAYRTPEEKPLPVNKVKSK